MTPTQLIEKVKQIGTPVKMWNPGSSHNKFTFDQWKIMVDGYGFKDTNYEGGTTVSFEFAEGFNVTFNFYN